MRLALVAFLFALGTACVSDSGVSGICGTETNGFDIEEASSLEDAQGFWSMHDAVVLDFDPSTLPAGAKWRVKSVEILPMIGEMEFGYYSDGQRVTVEVWDADDPHGTPYTVTQTFSTDDHEWEDVHLTSPSSAWEYDQKQAWWRFDFSDTIPVTGMTSPTYIVGVSWDSSGLPTLGYSNFNRPCSLNWTDYDDGRGFVLNSDAGSGSECSWPMLRVHLEILEERAVCEGSSVEID